MQVALWIGTALVFSLAQVGMILAWVMAGTVLRLAQEEITGMKLFAYVRVLGVRKAGLLAWAAGTTGAVLGRDRARGWPCPVLHDGHPVSDDYGRLRRRP